MAKDNLAGRMVLRLYLCYTEPDLDEPLIRKPKSDNGKSLRRPYLQNVVQDNVNRLMPSLMADAFTKAMPVSLLWRNAASSRVGYTFSWREWRPRK